jgi:anion-transporting  ArsA/GET3 family ATPase
MTTYQFDRDIIHLIGHRLVFVLGKGGTGKTTLSTALAFAAEAAGKNVLLVETEDGNAIARLFGKEDFNEIPVSVSTGISIAKILPRAEMEAYTQSHVKSSLISKYITSSRLFEYLSGATPGLKEIMTLGRLWRWETSRNKDGSPVYDIIIVDSPATGHALNLLRLPKTLIDMIRVGPIVSQVKILHTLLKDQTRTALTLVSLPEELPINESVELMASAREQIGMPIQMVFLNGVYPEVFSSPPPQAVSDMIFSEKNSTHFASVSNPEALEAVIAAVRHHCLRRKIHEKYLDYIKTAAACPVAEVPFYFTNNLTIHEISAIADDLLMPDRIVARGGLHA